MTKKSENIDRLGLLIGFLTGVLWVIHIYNASEGFPHLEDSIYWLFAISGFIIFYYIGYFLVKAIGSGIAGLKISKKKLL